MFATLMIDHHAGGVAMAAPAGLDPAPPGVTFEAYDPESGKLRAHAR